MTETLDTAVASLVDAVNEISDPVERYQVVRSLEDRIEAALKQVKADIAKSMHDGRSWKEVGAMLGVTGSRAEQISRGAR